jgi:hypothetical protein
VDRFASNTLRTLAIVAISIVVIIGSLALLLLALCFGMLGNLGGSGHHDPQVVNLMFGALAAAVVLVTIGVLSVAKLAKGIIRESAMLSPQLQMQSRSSSLESLVAPPSSPPDAHLSTALPNIVQPSTVQPVAVQPQVTLDVVTHLSPASRAAIQHLVFAIVAQVASQVVPVILGWRWALRTLPTYHQALLTTFLSVLATNVPYLALLFSLLRRPGRRTFAYSLAIPSLLILFGGFGSPATIFYLLRMTHSATSFLMLIPWALHVLILYLAWKAIRLTGILPNPARIVVAAVVVFFYYALLPVLLIVLNYFHR